jgi:hypothetical protein
LRREWADMNQVNGQSFIAQKLGLKSSQGSESLFGGRVKHLLVQGIGQGRTAFRLISGPDFAEKRLGWVEMPMPYGSRRLRGYKDAFLRLSHSCAVISQISDGKRPET